MRIRLKSRPVIRPDAPKSASVFQPYESPLCLKRLQIFDNALNGCGLPLFLL
jgi:hypothetical protein